MNINKKTDPSLELKISDWELDFYSRPIVESNGKKRWELIICSTKSFKTEDIFLWNKKCPANEVNSIWLTNALNEALNDAKKEGWAKPSIVRFWRSSMKSIIKKSLEAIKIEALVSRRTYNLFDRIEFLEKEIYPKEKGYVRGVLAPTFTSTMENPPKPLPEAVRGDALTISEISIGELKSAQNWPIEFGDIFPIQQTINSSELVPGLRLFSKDRSLALSAWFSCLEPIKLTIDKNQLILEASENDKWLVTDLPEKDADILRTKFLENKKNSFGYQFISIQSTPYIEKFAGFWILRDIELIS
ncbi:MAG: Tab2/Atab2 family RNA-binding protein [Prochlorococcus marinus CUG1439]|uniref:Tab2 family RNA-binding protein n=1 Tax=Prochlorococcus sp. MIT 1314 TaxID=3096220 RepID=UPI001B214242|nr:Tab2 family RNA-binding protein [Prochlorococcus sp. MIT 1314]MCR8539854.1 Tab2/Atab2 family RNA-binding protein [Prochlorococcus marinus CUG1439]